MNTRNTMDTLARWMALDVDERAQFDRAVAALEEASHIATKPVRPAGDGVPGQLSMFGASSPFGGTAGVAPLPVGSGQRPARIPLLAFDPEVFMSAAFRSEAADSRVVHVYVASSLGTSDLYRQTATCIYKTGTTVGPVAARITALNEIGYAAWRPADGALVEEPGFRTWRSEPIPLRSARPSGSPVCVTNEGLAVRVPMCMTVEQFDVAITEALRQVSIASLLSTPRFRMGLLSQGYDPAVLERYSRRADGSGHKRVGELYRIQPKRDADSLAALAEGVIARGVLARQSRAADLELSM